MDLAPCATKCGFAAALTAALLACATATYASIPFTLDPAEAQTGQRELDPDALPPDAVFPQYPLPAPRNIFVPRAFPYVDTDEIADVVVQVENGAGVTLTNVEVQIANPAALPAGITDLSGVVAFGDIPAGATTPGAIRLELAGAPVGVHPIELQLTANEGSATATLLLPVWDLSATVLDFNLGQGTAEVTTPMATDSMSLQMPEVFDGAGLPSHFDFQSLSDTRVFAESFFGVHWGDISEEIAGTALLGARSASGAAGPVDVHFTITDKAGNPVPGAQVTMVPSDGSMPITGFTDSNGMVWFMGIPSGSYGRRYAPPPQCANLWSNVSRPPFNFEMGKKWNVTGKWPTKTAGAATSPTPPPANGGGSSTTRSASVGAGVGILAGLLDIGLAPETLGGSIASLLIGTGASTAGGVLADPINSDIFFAGEENTIPLTETELTLSESVNMTYNVLQPSVGEQNLIVESSWDFTRTTDAQIYNWSSMELLDVPLFLRLRETIATLDGFGERVFVTTRVLDPDFTAQTGGGATLAATLYRATDMGDGFDRALLHDDGQAPDAAANDGVYSAWLTVPSGETAPMDVAVAAIDDTAFTDEDIPALFGWTALPVALCESDFSGDRSVGPTDLLILLAAFGDLFGPDDLLALLAAWGTNCP